MDCYLRRLTFKLAVWLFFSALLGAEDFSVLRSADGSEIEARVLRLEGDLIVIERKVDGQVFSVDAERFHPDDRAAIRERAMEASLAPLYPKRAELHALLGLAFFPERGSLWEAGAARLAQEMGLRAQSRGSALQSFSSEHGHRVSVLGEACHQVRLFADSDKPERFTFLFDNRAAREVEGQLVTDMEHAMREIRRRMEAALRELLGTGRVRSMFRGGGFTEHPRIWEFGDTAIVLAHSDSYVVLRIMPLDVAENAGRSEQATARALRDWTRSNVSEAAEGDVLIGNIPMTNQGPYGFCVPATFERYLRYMKIPADMHLIAMHAGSSALEGTSMRALIDTAGSYVQANQRRMRRDPARFFEHFFVSTQQDGRPIVWTMTSTEAFNRASNEYTSARKKSDTAALEQLRKAVRLEKDVTRAHVVLITGYNAKREEIRISDSWGPDYEERWIPREWAEAVSMDEFYVIEY